MSADREVQLRKIVRNLTAAAGDLWRLVKDKDGHGKRYFSIPMKTYEDHLADALAATEKALYEAGVVGVWSEMEQRGEYIKALHLPQWEGLLR